MDHKNKLSTRLKRALTAFKEEGEYPVFPQPEPVKGDGNAVFFTEGTEEDYREYEEEQQGWKGWMTRMGLR